MGFVRATTVHTLKSSVAAGAASDTAGGGRASVQPCWVRVNPPVAGGDVVASVAMMSEAMTVRVLSIGVKTQSAFRPMRGGEACITKKNISPLFPLWFHVIEFYIFSNRI